MPDNTEESSFGIGTFLTALGLAGVGWWLLRGKGAKKDEFTVMISRLEESIASCSSSIQESYEQDKLAIDGEYWTGGVLEATEGARKRYRICRDNCRLAIPKIEQYRELARQQPDQRSLYLAKAREIFEMAMTL